MDESLLDEPEYSYSKSKIRIRGTRGALFIKPRIGGNLHMQLATIIYHLAIACWLGGAALVIISSLPARQKEDVSLRAVTK